MAKCSHCSATNLDSSKFCSSCATPLDAAPTASHLPTGNSPSPPRSPVSSQRSPSRSDSSDDGRFIPGTLLGGRYRIISLLGAGGMGEVYRATDLRLAQPVALKFLPVETARDSIALERFYNEVRMARQVGHPNVCRVYDIGEVEGHPYISMEYVDGEDLHSLLRRIGRLPSDKALEIARKLCAGLAAAHDKGVLHRDLKPANIMIDGRGQVLITDFGLAAIMGQVQGIEARNGTPGYMAPEQLSGTEVSAQSDIYALGVVLYEMFTGKRPFVASTRGELVRMVEEGTPPSMGSIVKDIDPTVEKVVLRCLSPDPRNRPTSALAVSASLPGGDPLAAALAAGETPSPEMVAASGENIGLKPATALIWLLASAIGLVLLAILMQRVSLLTKIPFSRPPESLADKAQEVLAEIGYPERIRSSAYGFSYQTAAIPYLLRAVPGPIASRLTKGRPTTVAFWYRTSPQALVPTEISDVIRVTRTDPPADTPGMLTVTLDPQGRLFGLTVVPPRFDDGKISPAPDWNALFAAAKLDMGRFHKVDPQWTPPSMADARAAWMGTYPEALDIPIRVEAAAFHGKPVYFAQLGPWASPTEPSEKSPGNVVYLTLQLIIVVGSIPFARYNLRTGRGDHKGALHVALFGTSVGFLAWLIGGTHVTNYSEADLFFLTAMRSIFGGVTFGMAYISFEPFVRRKWPQIIVSWSRLLAGGWRDPLVGRDALYGTGIGILSTLVQGFGSLLYQISGIPAMRLSLDPATLVGGRILLGQFVFLIGDALFKSLGILFLIFVARLLLRKQWLVVGVLTVVLAGINAFNAIHPWIGWPVNIVFFGLIVLTLMRRGLLAASIALFVSLLLTSFPIGTDLSVWYSSYIVFTVAVVAALAGFGYWSAVNGRPLCQNETA